MNLFLVTGLLLDSETRAAFLVRANTRQQAKGKVQAYCQAQGWQISSFLHSHDLSDLLSEGADIVRIDHSVR